MASGWRCRAQLQAPRQQGNLAEERQAAAAKRAGSSRQGRSPPLRLAHNNNLAHLRPAAAAAWQQLKVERTHAHPLQLSHGQLPRGSPGRPAAAPPRPGACTQAHSTAPGAALRARLRHGGKCLHAVGCDGLAPQLQVLLGDGRLAWAGVEGCQRTRHVGRRGCKRGGVDCSALSACPKDTNHPCTRMRCLPQPLPLLEPTPSCSDAPPCACRRRPPAARGSRCHQGWWRRCPVGVVAKKQAAELGACRAELLRPGAGDLGGGGGGGRAAAPTCSARHTSGRRAAACRAARRSCRPLSRAAGVQPLHRWPTAGRPGRGAQRAAAPDAFRPHNVAWAAIGLAARGTAATALELILRRSGALGAAAMPMCCDRKCKRKAAPMCTGWRLPGQPPPLPPPRLPGCCVACVTRCFWV